MLGKDGCSIVGGLLPIAGLGSFPAFYVPVFTFNKLFVGAKCRKR